MARQRRKASAIERRSGGAAWALAGLLGAAVGAAALVAARWVRRKEAGDGPIPAAFTRPVAEPGSFDQTRDAGPADMRDEDGALWDEVDEGSDESFPASDPPSHVSPQSRFT